MAVRRVLEDPSMGGFVSADIQTLLNPDPQTMREALLSLFKDRQKDDLLVLYFSGHGVTSERGVFYLTCSKTVKGRLEATAIPSEDIHRLMESSRSQKQVVVLDCCFSGAFAKGMAAKGVHVNLEAQLGGQGRAVLTSSSSTEYSYEQKESDLSVYTRYWVEGIQTGAADIEGKGWISVDDLHRYTKRKVQESTPVMKPEIYAAREGYNILLTQAPIGDPNLKYRKEVEEIAQKHRGRFSSIILTALDEKQRKLGISYDTAQSIQNDVLRPYRELEEKLERYEKAVRMALLKKKSMS